MRYLEELKALIEKALKAKPKRIFEMKNLSDLDDVGHAIYVFEEIDGKPKETYEKFSRYKSAQTRKPKAERRACAALNEPSSILYVGSSTTGIKTRIKGHLGDGAKGTYALHLSSWFEGKYKVTVRDYGDLDRRVIQLIEDDLSYELKPAFGKKGGNGKLSRYTPISIFIWFQAE